MTVAILEPPAALLSILRFIQLNHILGTHNHHKALPRNIEPVYRPKAVCPIRPNLPKILLNSSYHLGVILGLIIRDCKVLPSRPILKRESMTRSLQSPFLVVAVRGIFNKDYILC